MEDIVAVTEKIYYIWAKNSQPLSLKSEKDVQLKALWR